MTTATIEIRGGKENGRKIHIGEKFDPITINTIPPLDVRHVEKSEGDVILRVHKDIIKRPVIVKQGEVRKLILRDSIVTVVHLPLATIIID